MAMIRLFFYTFYHYWFSIIFYLETRPTLRRFNIMLETFAHTDLGNKAELDSSKLSQKQIMIVC